MMKLRVIVSDDEPPARKYLRVLLQGEGDCEIVAECGDAHATIAAIRTLAPDLVFLDVQMPGQSGFDVIEAVGVAKMPYTVFVTAHDKYALPAFDRHAIDYLLKPFGADRFRQAMQRVRQQLELRHDAEWSRKVRSLLMSVPGALLPMSPDEASASSSDSGADSLGRGPVAQMAVRIGQRTVVLQTSEIEWIEAADYYAYLHRQGESFLIREALQKLESKLDPKRFLRIHRSAIVNIGHVREIRPNVSGGHDVIMKDGKSLPLGRRRKADIVRRLGGVH